MTYAHPVAYLWPQESVTILLTRYIGRNPVWVYVGHPGGKEWREMKRGNEKKEK